MTTRIRVNVFGSSQGLCVMPVYEQVGEVYFVPVMTGLPGRQRDLSAG